MRLSIKTVFLLLIFTVCVSAQGGRQRFNEYDRLAPKPKALFDRWASTTGVSPRSKFQSLTASQHSTFQAVTNALAHSRLTGSNGRTIAYAIDLVSDLQMVAGQEEGKGGDEQFRIYVKLVPGAAEKLLLSREFSRGKDNTVFHHGFPINIRQKGKPPTLQFSLTAEKDRADIDVDYRSSGFPAALFNGHLTAGNSDVREGKNYPTHTSRWFGLIDWWDRNIENLLSGFSQSSRVAEVAHVQVAGHSDLPDASAVATAADEFLTAWFVKHDTDRAMRFVSEKLSACLDVADRGAERVFRERRRLLFLTMLSTATKNIRKVDRLDQAISALKPLYKELVPLDHNTRNAYTLAHAPASYYRHFVCDGTTENWIQSTDVSRDRIYGEYYVSMFRFLTKDGQGGGIKLFWVYENRTWKIITFDAVNV